MPHPIVDKGAYSFAHVGQSVGRLFVIIILRILQLKFISLGKQVGHDQLMTSSGQKLKGQCHTDIVQKNHFRSISE